ncbi:hypothetical protein E3O06_15470 [Cryobacterium glaciale]|uniref:PNPLA domain-containing protein n=1 Tax=Cryobacterium glaciale TaxID=1259145 RepID=A0A4R8USN4_9MICO|nr:patatin-like phospholipase family protein [Cryobacterium glaciale]TFB69715.1 hypothetical protein E3O06_15470 [Cryobacterium glaciale]
MVAHTTLLAPDLKPFTYPPLDRLVSGIFKGGGAKGIVYCGALHELRARGVWFDSVAGSSAGAITAALIASGHDPMEITILVPNGLSSLKKNFLTWMGNVDRGLFKTEKLRDWLDGAMRAKLGMDESEPLTFAALAIRSSIELNVVAMDLALREPIVFNASITPDLLIAEAVVASSAIPVVLPTRRILVGDGHDMAIHRLVDGGTWANYPSFVYQDTSFRAYFGLASVPDRATLGFVVERTEFSPGAALKTLDNHSYIDGTIQWPPPPPPISTPAKSYRQTSPRFSRFDQGSARRMGATGALLTWAALRWIVGVGGVSVIAVSLLFWWADVVVEEAANPPQYMPLQSAILVVSFFGVLVGLIACVCVVAITIRLLPEAIESGLPSILAATSVGPAVPRWVGHDPHDPVLRLSSPLGITTAKFKTSILSQRLAVLVAAEQASAQLDLLYPDSRALSVPAMEDLLPVLDSPRFATYPEQYVVATSAVTLSRRWQQTGRLYLMLILIWGSPAVFFFWLSPSFFWLTIGLGLVLALTLANRLLRGRMRNQSLLSRHPDTRKWAGSLVASIFCLTLACLIAIGVYSDEASWSSQSDALVFLNSATAVLLLIGAGRLASVFSRVSANLAARRYYSEIHSDRGVSVRRSGSPTDEPVF